MLESFVKEIKILTYCRHPNIVRLIDASLDGVMIKEATLSNKEYDSTSERQKLE